MRKINLNEALIHSIQQKLSPSISVTKYLQNILLLGKEPAYRRMRNQVPFTFEEVVKIANDLHLSIDNLVLADKRNHSFNFGAPVVAANRLPEIAFESMMHTGNLMMEKVLQETDSYISATFNRLPLAYFYFPLLFKFEYCRFLQMHNSLSMDVEFDSIVLSDNLMALHKQTAKYASLFPKIDVVIQSNVFDRLITEINYLRAKSVFSETNVKALQDELYSLVDALIELLIDGSLRPNQELHVYSSPLPVDTNCAYFRYGDTEGVLNWIYFENPILIENNQIVNDLHKNYMKSWTKSSILLTKSNELLQLQGYKTMRQNVAKLSEPIETFPFNWE
jgi:hypothetical protein